MNIKRQGAVFYFDLFENQEVCMIVLDQELHVRTNGDFPTEDTENLLNPFLQEFLFLGLKKEKMHLGVRRRSVDVLVY